jgi:tyrosine-protein kinase Etk/Wzc
VDDREITFTDFLPGLWRYKWLIAGLVIVSVAVAWAVTVRQPRIYDATTTLLIPKDGAGGLTSTIASLGLGGGSGQGGGGQGALQLPSLVLGSGTPNRDVVLSVLKSRTLAKAVVERFKLQERYGSMFLQDAVSGLMSTTTVSLSKDGLVVLTVAETDPVLAADIANFCVEELERLVARFGLVEAKRHRLFVADQLALAKRNLVSAEDTLRAYQERNRAVVLQEQVRGAIEAAGRLKGEIIASEVRLQVMRDFATERDPDLVALRRRVEEMKRQLGQMQHSQDQLPIGDGKNGPILSPDFSSMPLVKMPRVGLELARLTRDFKVQETLVALLIQQFEQAKIAEAKDPPIMRVLDPATPPVRHSRPRLRPSLLAAAAGALVVGLLLTCVLEYLRINRARAVIA